MGKGGDTAMGAAHGAGSGAIAGTMVLPGWGTVIGAGVGGVVGGIGGYLSSDSGGGGMGGTGMRLNSEAGDFQYDNNSYDPNTEFSGAEKRARWYDALGSHYSDRPDTAADYTTADQDYARQQEARAQQMALGQQYQDVIAGKTPSLAEMQMRAGQDATAQQSLNMAASARGGGGLLAAQQAMNANALGQQNVNRDAGMLRAQETAQARDAYGNLINNVRGADLGSMGQRADMAQAQAGINLTSQQQRYAQGLGYRTTADSVRQDQRDANIGIWQGNQSARTAMATGAQQAAAADRASNRGMVAGLGAGGMQAAATYMGGKKGGLSRCLTILESASLAATR
ncbi:MAG: hypothetical protein KBD62_35085 [Kofleriaceae bacterium]|nr:hypothetical protein [Kofleriaceae bacterium]